jgi:hypothetical protein
MLRSAFYNGQLTLLALQAILVLLWFLFRSLVRRPIADMEERLQRVEDEVELPGMRILYWRRYGDGYQCDCGM